MVTLLPVGEEAALSRARRPLVYASSIESELIDAAERIVGTKDRVTGLLAQARQAPLDVSVWSNISLEAYAERRQVPRFDPHRSDPWEMIDEYAKQAYRMAFKMLDIGAAGAPICDVHGVMLRNSADGDRWQCAGIPACRSRYWWLDGSHVTPGR